MKREEVWIKRGKREERLGMWKVGGNDREEWRGKTDRMSKESNC